MVFCCLVFGWWKTFGPGGGTHVYSVPIITKNSHHRSHNWGMLGKNWDPYFHGIFFKQKNPYTTGVGFLISCITPEASCKIHCKPSWDGSIIYMFVEASPVFVSSNGGISGPHRHHQWPHPNPHTIPSDPVCRIFHPWRFFPGSPTNWPPTYFGLRL